MIHRTAMENPVGLHMFVQLGQTGRSANRHHCVLEDRFLSLRSVQSHVNKNELGTVVARYITSYQIQQYLRRIISYPYCDNSLSNESFWDHIVSRYFVQYHIVSITRVRVRRSHSPANPRIMHQPWQIMEQPGVPNAECQTDLGLWLELRLRLRLSSLFGIPGIRYVRHSGVSHSSGHYP